MIVPETASHSARCPGVCPGVKRASSRHVRPPSSAASSMISPPWSGRSAPTRGAVHAWAYTGQAKRARTAATPPQ